MTKEQFASQWSFEDWSDLCRDTEFNRLVESGEFAAAEARAWQLLNEEINN